MRSKMSFFTSAEIGGVQAKRAVLVFIVLCGQHSREIQIPSLVVRGVGVGDVIRQYFGAFSAKAQGLLMDTERFIEADAHVGKPVLAGLSVYFRRYMT